MLSPDCVGVNDIDTPFIRAVRIIIIAERCGTITFPLLLVAHLP